MNPKNEFGDASESLPTNIESATREHIRNNLASWDAKIRTRRAKRLNVSQEQLAPIDDEPLFMVEIRARAAAEDRPVDLVLNEYRKKLQNSTYPTPECLLPDEVAAYAARALSLDRLEHARVCNACATLVAAAVPSDQAAAEFIEVLRTAPAIKEKARAGAGFDWVFVEKWVGAAVVPAVALLAVYFVSLRIDSVATRQTFLQSPLPWLAGVVTALFGWIASELKQRPVFRSIGIGLAFAGVLGSSFLVDFRHRQSAERDLAIKSALDQLTQISVTSLQNRQINGQFIDVQHSSGPLEIQTAALSSSQVRYVGRSKQVPGQAIAYIGDDGGGEIKWKDGDKTIRQLQFLIGRIHNDGGVFKVRLPDGREYDLAGTGFGNLAQNTPVLAVIDPNTESVHSLQILNRSPQEAWTRVPENKSVN